MAIFNSFLYVLVNTISTGKAQKAQVSGDLQHLEPIVRLRHVTWGPKPSIWRKNDGKNGRLNIFLPEIHRFVHLFFFGTVEKLHKV